MEFFTIPEEIRCWSRRCRIEGLRVGLVPTMGALHEGHLSLVDRAAADADRVAVSLFVNPTQFAPGDDFERYPRDRERDRHLLEERGADALFAPGLEAIYPVSPSPADHRGTWVVETDLSARLEGAHRPGHFRGVATVVVKLLHCVEPDLLVMGQKDAQQAAIIGRVIGDLLLPTRLVVVPTVREADGLAHSSRNAYLSSDERRQAVCLFRALSRACRRVAEGERDPAVVRQQMREIIEQEPDAQVEYIVAVDPETFAPVPVLSPETLFCLAVRIGDIRLIDNMPAGREV